MQKNRLVSCYSKVRKTEAKIFQFHLKDGNLTVRAIHTKNYTIKITVTLTILVSTLTNDNLSFSSCTVISKIQWFLIGN